MTLEMGELAMAEAVGRLRQSEAIKRGKKDAHGLKEQDDASLHIYGAQAEVAAAKALGMYWDGGVNVWSGADLGKDIQVRARTRITGELIVREKDKEEHNFVLVTGLGPEFFVVGWLPGKEAKQRRYLSAPSGRPPAYFVPVDELLSLETLPR